MPYAAFDGVRLHYEETGTGYPILFAHEFAADCREWETQIRWFARSYRCIAFNAPGYPPSDVPEDGTHYEYGRQVGAIAAVLRHLGLPKAHVVGLSMGAYAALHFGLRYPEMASALVVAGCGSGAPREHRAQFRAEAEALADRLDREGWGTIAGAMAQGATRVQLQNKDPRGWAEFVQHLGAHSAKGSALTLRHYQAVRPSLFDAEAELKALRVPVLLIVGDEDLPCLETNLFLKRVIPSAGLWVVPRTGHAVNLEEPDAFNREVQAFLSMAERGRWGTRDPRTQWAEKSSADRKAMNDGDELLARARALVPMLRARAVATERDRRISDEVMAALSAADLFRVAQPRRYGGFALDFEFLPRIAMELAAGCASTAWVYVASATGQWIFASFPIAAQDDLWGRDPGTVACGSFAPSGKAVAVNGGFRLSGRWGFASGCDNAQWAMLGTILPAGGGRAHPAPAFLLVPARDYAIEDDWFAVGLAGTGSKTLVLDDVFVPGHRALGFAQLLTGNSPGAAAHGDPLYRMPMLACVPASLGSVALGAAQGALDDYIEGTRDRVTRGAVAGASNRMGDFATVQLRVAEAAASVDAARMILLRDLRAVLAAVRAGGEVTVADRITARRGHAFAVKLALAAVEALNAATGGSGLLIDQPVQRAWRDVNAVARHISLNWDAVGTMYGQHVLGREPMGQY